MSVSSLPPFYDMPFTDDGGHLTTDAQLYMDQTFQTLDVVVEFFNLGVQMPQFTNAQIVVIAQQSTVPLGTMWYDTTNNKLVVKTKAILPWIETITSV